jgi:hypothetical protein
LLSVKVPSSRESDNSGCRFGASPAVNSKDNPLNAAFAAWTRTHRELVAIELECERCAPERKAKKGEACCRRRDAMREKAAQELRIALGLLQSHA